MQSRHGAAHLATVMDHMVEALHAWPGASAAAAAVGGAGGVSSGTAEPAAAGHAAGADAGMIGRAHFADGEPDR